jgi:hypothetical protein
MPIFWGDLWPWPPEARTLAAIMIKTNTVEIPRHFQALIDLLLSRLQSSRFYQTPIVPQLRGSRPLWPGSSVAVLRRCNKMMRRRFHCQKILLRLIRSGAALTGIIKKALHADIRMKGCTQLA